MKRGGPLRVDPEKVRAWKDRSRSNLDRRTDLAPRSEKRKAEDRVRSEMMRRVRERDGNRCRLAPLFGSRCFGELHGHEILKSSRGGSRIDESNVILACDFHNGLVEDEPDLANALGLATHSWQRDLPTQPNPRERQLWIPSENRSS